MYTLEQIEEVIDKNGINMPRIRYFSLMKDEKFEDIDEIIRDYVCYVVERVIDDWTFSYSTRQRCKKYLIYDYYTYADGSHSKLKTCPVGIKWDKIHGKLRKKIKFEIKQEKKKIIAQYEMWNKYCGQDDILYIHTRCGGGNWNYYKDQITSQPGYIESVENAFDCTYLDSYFKVNMSHMT